MWLLLLFYMHKAYGPVAVQALLLLSSNNMFLDYGSDD